MDKARKPLMSALLGAAVFAFWMWLYPQGLNYQEQNQLFLFTWDYLRTRLALPGGGADCLSEFLVQFFYFRWAGALLLALLAVLFQVAVWAAAASVHHDRCRNFYAFSFIPSLLLLAYMGDMEVLVSYPVALVATVSLCPLFAKARWHRLWLIPLGWWLLGPVIVVPVLFSVLVGRKWQDLVLAAFTLAVFWAGYRLLAAQYPMRDAFFGINYHRLRDTLPALQVIIPGVTLLCVFGCSLRTAVPIPAVVDGMLLLLFLVAEALGTCLSYDRDAWEVLAYDDLIRHGRYHEVVRRAEKYQPKMAISACSVNFCLFMDGQLESRMPEFYQCGTQGLVQPSVKDNLSDITSAELLWMMGMPNITLQYCFDLQESIQNGRKSGRFMQRIADCNIVNGWYDRASRYLDILGHSLFYRRWARERKAMLRDESRVVSDPVYAYVRSVRFQDDFITVYDSLDLMMAILYNQNKNNFMAAQYYQAWQRLKQGEAAQ